MTARGRNENKHEHSLNLTVKIVMEFRHAHLQLLLWFRIFGGRDGFAIQIRERLFITLLNYFLYKVYFDNSLSVKDSSVL